MNSKESPFDDDMAANARAIETQGQLMLMRLRKFTILRFCLIFILIYCFHFNNQSNMIRPHQQRLFAICLSHSRILSQNPLDVRFGTAWDYVETRDQSIAESSRVASRLAKLQFISDWAFADVVEMPLTPINWTHVTKHSALKIFRNRVVLSRTRPLTSSPLKTKNQNQTTKWFNKFSLFVILSISSFYRFFFRFVLFFFLTFTFSHFLF